MVPANMIVKPSIWLVLLALSLSCGTEKNERITQAADINIGKSTVGKFPDSTVHFRASGNEPFWSLEIDFDKKIHFKSLNHPQEIITPVPEPEIAQDYPVARYHAVTERGELIVSISPDTCIDSMSGRRFPFRVTVAARLTIDSVLNEFQGCGQHMLDTMLHNIWVVKEMKGEDLQAEDFSKGLPTLEIYSAAGRITGHDGCNRLFGNVTGNMDIIKFGALGSTMMACPDMEKSNELISLISGQSFEYVRESGLLLLKQNEQVMLALRNVD